MFLGLLAVRLLDCSFARLLILVTYPLLFKMFGRDISRVHTWRKMEYSVRPYLSLYYLSALHTRFSLFMLGKCAFNQISSVSRRLDICPPALSLDGGFGQWFMLQFVLLNLIYLRVRCLGLLNILRMIFHAWLLRLRFRCCRYPITLVEFDTNP